MIEKMVLEEESDIVDYDFITIKPLSKSSQGSFLNQGIILALESGEIKVLDIYNNMLLNFFVEDKIDSISTSSSPDEMLVGVLVNKGTKMHIFNIELQRKESAKRGYNSKKNQTEEGIPKKERLGNQKYTHLLKSFDYNLGSHEVLDL